MNVCATGVQDRRRIFWSTQACSVVTVCKDDCLQFGLLYDREAGSPISPNPRSISTNNWLAGLVINILLTDGQGPERLCGYKPGRRGGHWSDSFRTDGQNSGSLLRKVGKTKTVQEGVNLIQSYAQASLTKLIAYGVATAVEVDAKYAGNGKVELVVTVIGPAGQEERVGFTSTRLNN